MYQTINHIKTLIYNKSSVSFPIFFKFETCIDSLLSDRG